MNYKPILILFGVLVALVISSFFFGEGFETGITGYFNKMDTSASTNASASTSASDSSSGSTSTSTNASTNDSSSTSTTDTTQSTYYDPYTKQTNTITTGTVYTGPNGKTITLTKNVDGSQSIVMSDGSIQFTSSSATIFTGPNGTKATIITTSDGKEAIKVDTPSGTTIYTINNMPSSAQYYGNTTTNVPPPSDPNQTIDTTDYSSSLPPGIPGSQIPPGQEDLYILKSQVVPPVCPVCPANCPNASSSINNKKCQPCKPCGRCPEPSMTCKAVPNYAAIGGGSNSLDGAASYMPVLSDFSNFGM